MFKVRFGDGTSLEDVHGFKDSVEVFFLQELFMHLIDVFVVRVSLTGVHFLNALQVFQHGCLRVFRLLVQEMSEQFLLQNELEFPCTYVE